MASSWWADRVYELVALGKSDDAMDVAFDVIDRYCWAGYWQTLGEDLYRLDVDRLDAPVLVGIVTFTWHAREHLPERVQFMTYAERRLRELVGVERAERLLEHRR